MAYEIESSFKPLDRYLAVRGKFEPFRYATEDFRLQTRRLNQRLTWDDLKIEPGSLLSLNTATRIPERMYSWLPRIVMKLKPKDQLTDWIEPLGCVHISQRFKDLLEAVAPGEVQFIPAQMIDPDGIPITRFGQRWFINVLNYVPPMEFYNDTNAEVVVTTEVNARNESYTKYTYEKKRPGFSISSASFKGVNIFWCFSAIDGSEPIQWFSCERDLFVSDALGEAMQREKISGIRLEKMDEV
jgi:hypothetical protein